MKVPIYLDYAAATPLRSEVIAAMRPFFTEQFYNPSATYLNGQKSRDALESARSEVAHCLGVRSSEIIFTAGGTEANNLAISGIMSKFPDASIAVLATEHDSVLEPARHYKYSIIPVLADGSCTVDALHKAIDETTVLVSVGYVNNEIGTVQSLRDIAAAIKEIQAQRNKNGNKLPLYFHTDACQAGNYLPLQVSRLEVDMMTLNGGKLYGPKQSGVLYVRAGIDLQPLLYGGGQEFGKRSGTENVAGSIGFARALALAQEKRHDMQSNAASLQGFFIKELSAQLPAAVINGSRKMRVANNVHVTFPGKDNERLMMQLDEQGVMCAVGSACSASKDEPSHVLKAIGLNDEAARSSLRFTFGEATTEADIRYVMKLLTAIAS